MFQISDLTPAERFALRMEGRADAINRRTARFAFTAIALSAVVLGAHLMVFAIRVAS
jgi:hypothetical protein